MKLSAAQIQKLFLFTEKKYVRYYDLQVEIVDHLAIRIEEIIAENSKIDFETALQKVYNDFGIFGFGKIVQQKEQQVIRAGRRLVWKEVKNYFRWPGLILIIFIALGSWQLTSFIKMEILFPVFIAGWLSAGIVLAIKVALDIKKQKKKLLIIQFSPALTQGTFFFFEWMLFTMNRLQNQYIFCIAVTIGVLFKFAACQAYKRIKKEAAVIYPEAFETGR